MTTTVSQEAREARIEHLRAEIRRCDLAIEQGTADNWWHIDRDRFRQELDDLTEPRHRQSAERGEVVGYIIPEMLNRKSEFEANGIVLHSRPSGMATMPLYTLTTPPEAVRTPIEGTSHAD